MEPSNPSLRVLIRSPASSSSSSSSSLSSSSSSSTSTTSPSPSVPNPTATPLRPCFSSSSSSSSLPPSNPPSSSSSQPPSLEGVVVVGFIGRSSDDLTSLINRILDANVFGSGNLDRNLSSHLREHDGSCSSWFRARRISYYYLEEKGIVFLQFSSSHCPLIFSPAAADSDLDSILQEHNSEHLCGMLLMFSVCHILIYLNEGSRFDTQILKKFRMLQAAKNSMFPFVKSQIAPSLNLKAAGSQPTVQMTASNSSPSRGGGIISRHSSAISLMSGLGSYPSLFPGQCTPVILFVFLDDFVDGMIPVSHVEDLPDASLANQSSTRRPSVPPIKGSNSIIMLTRPISKSEGSFRKKLQSSLEAQIRFLIKKCRTLAGMDSSHSGPRGHINVSSSPLFSLDASRAVILLDKSANHKAESLNFVTGIVEEVLNENMASDILLLENHNQSSYKEDIQSIKEFIYRQSDTLRGRGGLGTTTNGGSAAGVGMVAAAAAAAAASAASGKPFSTPPELPTLENWLSCTRLILNTLLSAKRGYVTEDGINKKPSLRRNATSAESGEISLTGTDAVQAAISCLESGRDLNMKFSMSWCQRALSIAKEIYLKDLPACYPTSQHEAHLVRALHSFKSMAKGPALQMSLEKLEEECMSIWKAGRQLCDAVSLTGKPCVHQRHNVDSSHLISETVVKSHSSGFIFLHACACGRSRQLRDDPFDFASANLKFNCFPNCDKLLPSFQLPQSSGAGHLMSSSWNLIRLGGARYYDPSEGLLQSGFCTNENFLQRWTILIEKWRGTDCFPGNATQNRFVTRFADAADPKIASVTGAEVKRSVSSQLCQGEVQTGGLNNQKNLPLNVSSNVEKIRFGTGLVHFGIKKPFSEVVAGFVASESAFPPLQQRKNSAAAVEKGMKQRCGRDQIEDQIHVPGDYQGPPTSANNSGQEISVFDKIGNNRDDGDPFLQIGSNVVPVIVNDGGKIKPNTSLKHVEAYFGFEHECSYGHRFLLSPKHLDMLGSPYSLPEESHSHSSNENSDSKAQNPMSCKKNIHANVHLGLFGTNSSLNKVRPGNVSAETVTNNKQYWNGSVTPCTPRKEAKLSAGFSAHCKSRTDLDENLYCTTVDNEESAVSLLNRNIPVYMNCPHCRISNSKKDKFKFASTVSQLQRIFLVTPPFPVVLATCPVVQFEHSCLPSSVPDKQWQSQFSLGCRVILPPESFVTIRLPFVYGVELEDRTLHPLSHLEHQPELAAWIIKGTMLQVVSKGEEFHL